MVLDLMGILKDNEGMEKQRLKFNLISAIFHYGLLFVSITARRCTF